MKISLIALLLNIPFTIYAAPAGIENNQSKLNFAKINSKLKMTAASIDEIRKNQKASTKKNSEVIVTFLCSNPSGSIDDCKAIDAHEVTVPGK